MASEIIDCEKGQSLLMSYGLFNRYASLIAALPPHRPLLRSDLLNPTFRIAKHGAMDIYYCPFELVNARAKIMLVGITPGWTQIELAYRSARDSLRDGLPLDVVLQRAKDTASFAGPMRTDFIAMLDGIGLVSALGIPGSAALFSSRSNLVHSTSVLRYPVFVDGENYTGGSPKMVRSRELREYICGRFREEVQAANNALIIPLGDSVSSALQLLVQDGIVAARRCLLDFPHPSGQNGHRKARYEEHRENMRAVVQSWFRA